MTDRELWETIWRALRMVEKAIAKKYGFGEFRIDTKEEFHGKITETSREIHS